MSPAVTWWSRRRSPLREARHVLLARMRVLRWLLIVLAVPAFLMLLMLRSVKQPAEAASNLWLLVSGIGLMFYGMVLAQAVCAAAREEDALRPQARLRWWQACARIGSGAIGFVWLAALLLVLREGGELTPARLLAWAAIPSLALAGGFAVVSAWLLWQQRAWFLAVLVFPLSLWGALQAQVLPHAPPLGLGLLWVCAWPAALVALRVALLGRRREPPPPRRFDAPGNAAGPLWMNHPLWVFEQRRFDPASADPRWLLRSPRLQFRWVDLISWSALVVILFLTSESLLNAFNIVVYAGLAGGAFVGLAGVMEGVRPRLLLLPGARFRRQLAWHVFRHALRRAAGLMPPVLAVIGFGALVFPAPWALRTACVVALLAGAAMLALALQVALRALIRRAVWRAVIQLSALLLMCGAGVLGATYWVGSPEIELSPSRVALAFSAAGVFALLSLAVVGASVKAWSRLDFAELTREERLRGPFDPPLAAQQRQP